MSNPFAIKSIYNYALRLLKEGCPPDRIPARCANRFNAFDADLSEWEYYFDSVLQKYRQEFNQKYEYNEEGYSIAQPENIEQIIRSGANLIITGKAGTGKTFLLKKLVNDVFAHGEVAILAPTGIAAKNAGGVTIHSFLKIKPGPWLPGSDNSELTKLSYSDKKILSSISTIIIDEVSMVRCDLMDQIDEVLRYARKSEKPFGGVQVILFGDMFQLMPVVTEEEYDVLKNVYSSPFFFSSKAFERIKKHVVVLSKVYRQDEPEFIDILNNIRIGRVSPMQLATLNSRFSASHQTDNIKNGIHLTTHNRKANAFNLARLEALKGKEYTYKATVSSPYEGESVFLDKRDWPTDYYLKLKEGARVMFLRNDNENNQYVNGTLGTVVELWDDGIIVRTDDGKIINVKSHSWWFYHYRFNKISKKVEREPYAIFKQFPLRLAWCVTIHKSQGLTFDNVYLDASKSFAAGQVYVALSRCRTLNGIHLLKRLVPQNIICDETIKHFYTQLGIQI